MKEKAKIMLLSVRGEFLDKFKEVLGDRYDIIALGNYDEAIKILARSIELFCAIMIDCELSIKEKTQFMECLREKEFDSFLPVFMVVNKLDEHLLADVFMQGVDDLVELDSNKLIISNRVKNYITQYKDKHNLKMEIKNAHFSKMMAMTSEKELRRKTQVLRILGSIYACVVYVNVENGKYLTMEAVDHVRKVIGPEGYAGDKIMEVARMFSTPQERKDVEKFADYLTVRERLKDRDVISLEFTGTVSGRVRVSIVAADRNSNQEVVHAILILQNIGNEHTTLEEEDTEKHIYHDEDSKIKDV